MEHFYILSQAEADLIGKFDVSVCEGIDPHAGKLTDGNYTIKESDVITHQARPEIKSVDFDSKVAVDGDTLDWEVYSEGSGSERSS